MATSEGRLVLVNAQTEKLFGYRRDELIGHPVERLLTETLNDIHPRHRKGYLKNARVRSLGAGGELRVRRKDGRELFVEINLSPIETETGLFVVALTVLWPLSLVPNAVAAGAMPALTREALAGEGLVPECIQKDASPEHMGQYLLDYIEKPETVQPLVERFTAIHHELRQNTDQRAAEAVLEVVEQVAARQVN